MSWYVVLDPQGLEVKRVLASTIEDLVANVPADHTAHPVEPEDPV